MISWNPWWSPSWGEPRACAGRFLMPRAPCFGTRTMIFRRWRWFFVVVAGGPSRADGGSMKASLLFVEYTFFLNIHVPSLRGDSNNDAFYSRYHSSCDCAHGTVGRIMTGRRNRSFGPDELIESATRGWLWCKNSWLVKKRLTSILHPHHHQRRYDDHRKQIDASEMAPLTCRPLKRNWPNERQEEGKGKWQKTNQQCQKWRRFRHCAGQHFPSFFFLTFLSLKGGEEEKIEWINWGVAYKMDSVVGAAAGERKKKETPSNESQSK